MDIKVALLGCGRIANKRHSPLLSSGHVQGAELAAVCDIDAGKARTLGEKCGVPWYISGDAMLDAEQPDVLAICTPSGMHARHALHFLEYGLPIIVEKPIALVVDDAEDMARAFQARNVPLFTVLQNRFNVPVQHLRRNFKRLGHIIAANVCVRWSRREDYYQDWHGTWAQAGGVLANQAIHHIDLLTWFLGLPRSVMAYESHTRSGEVEDTLVGVLRWDNGTVGTVEVTAAASKDLEGSLTFIGTGGTVKVGGFAANKIDVWQFEKSEADDEGIRLSVENPPDVYGFGHRQFYQHVVECLQTGKPSDIDGRDSLMVVTALYESVERKREVFLNEKPFSERLGQ